MAGLNCGRPSSLGWPYLRDGLDAAVAVTDGAAAPLSTRASSTCLPARAVLPLLAGARAALTGPGSDERRAELDVDSSSVVSC